MSPLISVIVPCYNMGKYLPECIDSVQNQLYKNFEIIIVDDGSTDKLTIHCLKSLQYENVKVHYQSNKGVSVARNIGASLSKGEYLLFLDSDDKIDHKYLQLAIESFNQNTNLSYVYCDLQEFGETNSYRRLEFLDLKKTLIYNQTHVSAVIKRSLWKLTKGFDDSFIKGWEDWDFIISILKMDIVFYKIPKAMLFYRISNKSRDIDAVNLYSKTLLNQIYLKHLDSYLKYFDEPIAILRNCETHHRDFLQLQQHTNNIYKTFSYRIGAFILMPFKLVKKYFF